MSITEIEYTNTQKTADFLSFMLLFAFLMHAVLILGISFNPHEKKTYSSQSLDLTLASFDEKKRPKNFDYLAQYNQTGSGTEDKASKPSSDLPAPFQGTVINEVTLQKSEKDLAISQQRTRIPIISTQVASSHLDDEWTKTQEQKDTKKVPNELSKIREDIASLEAAFYEQRELYANRPVVKRLNMATTGKTPGAIYMYDWRNKVTLIGNLNYPKHLKNNNMYGELELVVSIKKDGSLNSVEVLRSSGYVELDKAAIDIVQKSAPFDPFPPELIDNDIIEIIRTWRFSKGQLSSS